MTEDPQVPLPLDEQSQKRPVADSLPPVESQPGAGDIPPAGDNQPVGPDYVAEIRQGLIVEEAQQRTRTGGLIGRITGSLKRVTGPLRRKEEPGKPDSTLTTKPLALPDTMPDVRLDEVFFMGPGSDAEQPALPANVSDPNNRGVIPTDPAEDADLALAMLEPEGAVEEDSEVTSSAMEEDFDETFGTAETPAPAGEMNWMAEIRQETASLPPPPPLEEEQPPQKKSSGSLRTLLTGILKGGERRKRTDELEMDDSLVTGRLERSLHTQPLKRTTGPLGAPEDSTEPPAKIDDNLAAIDPAVFAMLMAAKQQEEKPERQQPAPADDLLEAQRALREEDVQADEPQNEPTFSADDEEEVPLDRMDFYAVRAARPVAEDVDMESAEVDTLSDDWDDGSEGASEATPAAEPPVMLSPEDEQILLDNWWTEQEEKPQQARPSSSKGPVVVQTEEEAYAVAFLTGQQVVVAKQQQVEDENLLRKSLGSAESEAVPDTIQEMRAIALEAYDEGADDTAAQTVEDMPIPLKLDAASWKAWFASRTKLEKILLVQLAFIAFVIIVAVPFFMFQLLRGPVETLKPRSLPADLPYPTGLTLPGGWHFDLNKSTFEGMQWRPAGSEWLEGTELRRVVALPWNRQTEAVVQTFQPGDQVSLQLSNQDELTYRVDRIERIPADDTTVFTEQKPSLVMILYNEKSEERWVVFCQP